MRKVIFVKPVDGLRVRDPKTRDLLPEHGKRVEMSSFWARRIEEKSVEVIPTNDKEEIKR